MSWRRTLPLLCVLALSTVACEKSPVGPSGSTSIAVPGYVAPANGELIPSTAGVTLKVRNALVTADSDVTYHFEVALDAAFAETVLTGDVPGDGSGQTSFAAGKLTPARYFWRVRATAGGDTGAFTQPISFTVGA